MGRMAACSDLFLHLCPPRCDSAQAPHAAGGSPGGGSPWGEGRLREQAAGGAGPQVRAAVGRRCGHAVLLGPKVEVARQLALGAISSGAARGGESAHVGGVHGTDNEARRG